MLSIENLRETSPVREERVSNSPPPVRRRQRDKVSRISGIPDQAECSRDQDRGRVKLPRASTKNRSFTVEFNFYTSNTQGSRFRRNLVTFGAEKRHQRRSGRHIDLPRLGRSPLGFNLSTSSSNSRVRRRRIREYIPVSITKFQSRRFRDGGSVGTSSRVTRD